MGEGQVVSFKLATALFLTFRATNLLCAQINQAHVVVSDVQYCTGAGKPLLMDIFVPEMPLRRPAPAVLWLHGGGWERGDKDETTGALLLTENGFITASINYRLSEVSPFPAAIEDCKCAIRFLRANAAQYGIDPERIGVAGASAGGHLALLVATSSENASLEGSGGWPEVSSRVAAASAWYGPTDFTVGEKAFDRKNSRAVVKFLGGSINQKPDVYRQASPITYVSSESPPILLVYGDRDETVPFSQATRMLQAYKRAGATAELIKVVGVGHDFQRAIGRQAPVDIDEIQEKTVEFFRKYLAEK
jgi:acetyl esterase/lipase